MNSDRERRSERGVTYLEMLATTGIMLILASAILPTAKATHQRAKEIELRRALREIRSAIDEYRARCDPAIAVADGKKIAFHDPPYPKDLDELVKGLPLLQNVTGEKIKFLRAIPDDPMTADGKWDLVCYRDEPDASWCGKDVWNVRSKSKKTALNGKHKYSEW